MYYTALYNPTLLSNQDTACLYKSKHPESFFHKAPVHSCKHSSTSMVISPITLPKRWTNPLVQTSSQQATWKWKTDTNWPYTTYIESIFEMNLLTSMRLRIQDRGPPSCRMREAEPGSWKTGREISLGRRPRITYPTTKWPLRPQLCRWSLGVWGSLRWFQLYNAWHVFVRQKTLIWQFFIWPRLYQSMVVGIIRTCWFYIPSYTQCI